MAAATSGPPAPSATAVAVRCDSAMQAICAPPSPAAESYLTDGTFTSAARPHRSPYGFMQQAGTMTLPPARAPTPLSARTVWLTVFSVRLTENSVSRTVSTIITAAVSVPATGISFLLIRKMCNILKIFAIRAGKIEQVSVMLPNIFTSSCIIMKKFTISLLGLLAAGLACLPAPAQELFEQLDFPNPNNTPAPVFPVPTER